MLKKTLLFALMLLPIGVFAQDKIAHFNSTEVIVAMPDYTAMQDSLKKIKAGVEAEILAMQEEYEKKYMAFIQEADTLIESVRDRRLKDIQDLEQRAYTYQQEENAKMAQVQQSLLQAIHTKVQEAVTKVGEENNFLYILDEATGAIPFVNAAATSATDLVKKKLGL